MSKMAQNKALLVKVCGINNQSNMKKIDKIGIDMLGINFYLGSKRYIGNTSITINPNIKRVGVFVDAIYDEVIQYTLECDLHYAQLHGDASPEFCKEIQEEVKVIKAFGIDKDFDFAKVAAYSFCDLFIFDNQTKEHGGSGQKFSWDKLQEYKGEVPFLLLFSLGGMDVVILVLYKTPLRRVKIDSIDQCRHTEIEIRTITILKIQSFP